MLLAALAAIATADAKTIYVDADAIGANSGSNWADAYNHLQDALADAKTLIPPHEIRVAAGTYKPDCGVARTSGDRTATFNLVTGVTIQGGYAGYTSPDPDARDIGAYETILSGDIGILVYEGDNSLHVVTSSGTDPSAVLDGFTITGGNDDDVWAPDPGAAFPDGQGGGLYNWQGDPTIRNCTFLANTANFQGGAIYNEESSPTFINCHIRANSASDGGGMYNRDSNPILTNCKFTNNSAEYAGGGMHNMGDMGSKPIVVNCMFSDNSAGFGGAMHNESDCDVRLFNCTFFGNSAEIAGGAVCNHDMTFPRALAVLVNCVLSGNSAGKEGAGICSVSTLLRLINCTVSNNSGGTGGGVYVLDTDAKVFNCLLWANNDDTGSNETAQLHHTPDSTLDIWYSCVQNWTGNLGGKGNIGDDPLFKDADGPDGIVGTEDDNLRLRIGSPCIDAGNNTALGQDIPDLDGDGDTTERIPLDLDGKSRFFDYPTTADTGVADPPDYPDIVDMGAYEFADRCGDDAHPYPAGDVNRDCKVNFLDIAVIAENWLTCTAPECE